MPSLGETAFDFRSVYDTFRALVTHIVDPSTYRGENLGDAAADDYQTTLVKGDLHLSGDAVGAGVLIVEGSLTITGKFSFQGLVIVAGDVRMSGTGSEAKVFGSVLVGQSLVTDQVSRTKGSGASRIYFSSEVLSRVENAVGHRYSIAYYDDK